MNKNQKYFPGSHIIKLIFTVNLSLFFLLSCGADVKSSSDVEKMFDNVKSLQDKMNVICSEISSNSEFDLSKHKVYGDEFCSDVPSDAVIDLNSVQNKELKYGKSDPGKEGDNYRHSIRLEVFANTGLLEGAQKALPTLKDLESTSSDAQFTIANIEKLKLDETNMTATAKIELTSPTEKNGSGPVQNKWKIYGKKVQNYFIITVDTYDKSKEAESLLNEAHLMIAVIPHAGDIYINLIGVFLLTSRGVDGAMDSALTKMITDTLYDIKQKFD